MKRWAIMKTALCALLGTCLAVVAQAYQFEQRSSPIFYIDTGITPQLRGMYVGYLITNNGGVQADVWVTIDSFTGGVVALAPNEDGVIHFGPMAAGESKMAYFYLQASGPTASTQSHTIRMRHGSPTATPFQSQTFDITAVEETIKANANKVDVVVTTPNPPTLGGIVTVSISGHSGTIGAAKIFSFHPATYLGWRADAFQLESATVTMSGGNTGVFTDRLYLTVPNTQDTDYVAEYIFRIQDTTVQPTAVSPVGFISSGTQIKHTDTSGYDDPNAIQPVQPPANKLLLSKSVSTNRLLTAGTVTYSLTLTNQSTVSTVVDIFTDTLPSTPAGVAYVPGSSTFNGVGIADPSTNGATLVWSSVFNVPAGSTRTLNFQATLPGITGTYTNRAVAAVGNAQIDTTLDTTDNSPAAAATLVQPWYLTGTVYSDANFNATRDGAEAGTGLALYAKLIATNAPTAAVAVAAVNPGTGAYSLSATNNGVFTVIIDDNNTANDVMPVLPTGWLGTEVPTQTRSNITVTNDVGSLNFGLFNGSFVTATKTASPALIATGSNVTYSVILTNRGPVDVTVTDVIDLLPTQPATVNYLGGSAQFNGSPLANPTISSNQLTWTGNFLVPTGAARVLSFQAAIPETIGVYTNTASARIGTLLVDTTTSGTDNVPANAIVTESPLADLGLTKSGATNVLASANLAYTLTVTNAGPSTATSIAVTDTLPAGINFVSASDGGTNAAGVVGWPLFNLANGASTNFTVTITAPASGVITNAASVTAATPDPVAANNTGAVVTTITPVADLLMFKSGNTNVVAGANLSYTIIVTNAGPSTASNVAVSDPLPTGAVFVSASAGGSHTAGVVGWPLITSLPAGGSTNFSVTVTAPGSGVLTNRAVASSTTNDPVSGNNDGSATASQVVTAISELADVSTTKSGSTNVLATANLDYTITVTNAGPSAASNVAVADTLPVGVIFVSASGGGTNVAGVVGWPLIPSLAAGGVTNFTVTVTAPASGVLTNIAASVADTADPDPTNNNGSAANARVISTVNESADLLIVKTGSTNVVANAQVVYLITVTNNGPSIASGVMVSDTLPAGVSFVSASGGGTNVAGGVGWPLIPSLAAGGVTNFTVTVTAPASGEITNTASVTSATGDPAPGNNSSQVTSTITGLADLLTFKSGDTNVVAGGNLDYTIIVTNAGPSNATNVTISDTLPAGAGFVSASGGGTNTAGVVGWPLIPSLPAGASTNLTVTLTAPASGVMTNTAASASDTDDPDATNNNGAAAASRVVTTISERADLITTKTGPASGLVSSNLVYSILVTNAGPSAAVNVVVTDALPAGTTFVGASGGGSESGGVVTWPAMASLPASATTNLTVTITAATAGVLTNVAASTSDTADPDPTNNDGSAASARVVTTVSLAGVEVSGRVFADLQPNGSADSGEDWAGGTNVFLNLVQNGAVVQSIAVAPGAGSYSFSGVSTGAYAVVVTTSAVAISAQAPAGWLFTSPTDGARPLVVGTSPVTGQTFGLFNGSRVAGQVFADTGTGGGTANNGTRDGTEPGISSVAVRVTDNSGTTTYATTTTDGAGNYILWVPASAGAATLKVLETNPSGALSTGGSAGTTGGAYDRSSDTVTFVSAPGTRYTGLDFADVPGSTFTGDGLQTALPGTTVVYAHTFTAGTAGAVTFTTTNTPNPVITGWTQVLHRDTNCNGVLDSGEPVLNGPVTVAAGDQVCILVKEQVPAGAPVNAQDQVVVRAELVFANQPALSIVRTRTDLTTVSGSATEGLTLVKVADKATAAPGETITYTLTYTNNGTSALADVVIVDSTPAFTTFTSAGHGLLPASLTAVTITAPGVGTTGAVKWQFTGTLDPGSSGTVNFSVTVD